MSTNRSRTVCLSVCLFSAVSICRAELGAVVVKAWQAKADQSLGQLNDYVLTAEYRQGEGNTVPASSKFKMIVHGERKAFIYDYTEDFQKRIVFDGKVTKTLTETEKGARGMYLTDPTKSEVRQDPIQVAESRRDFPFPNTPNKILKGTGWLEISSELQQVEMRGGLLEFGVDEASRNWARSFKTGTLGVTFNQQTGFPERYEIRDHSSGQMGIYLVELADWKTQLGVLFPTRAIVRLDIGSRRGVPFVATLNLRAYDPAKDEKDLDFQFPDFAKVYDQRKPQSYVRSSPEPLPSAEVEEPRKGKLPVNVVLGILSAGVILFVVLLVTKFVKGQSDTPG